VREREREREREIIDEQNAVFGLPSSSLDLQNEDQQLSSSGRQSIGTKRDCEG